MNELGNIIDILANNLLAMMPFVIVKSFQRGVRWTLGSNPKELQPGFHWRVYFVHEVELVSVCEAVIHLPGQTVTTKDGKIVYFSTSVAYEVNDAVAHYCNVNSFRESTITLAMRHLSARVRKLTYDEIVADQQKLEDSLSNTLTTRLKKWGTTVTDVGFMDFAEVKQRIRLFGDDDIFKHIEA